MLLKHPLLNSDSPHYDQGYRPLIMEIEEELTVREMIGVCEFNIFKYEHRQKGQDESDLKKADTYNAYLKFLLEYLVTDHEHIFVSDAMNYEKIKWIGDTK